MNEELKQGVLIKRNSNEWKRMWEWLADQSINRKLPEPCVALNELSGECWEYMGSFRNSNKKLKHTFRHRSHPFKLQRINLEMNATSTICAEDIEKESLFE